MIDFNLSEKGFQYPNEQGIWDGDIGYTEEDVKEFIKRLKERLNTFVEDEEEERLGMNRIFCEIDKLAGEELAGCRNKK